MFNINLLKKYAISYLSKYDSTKKNLERILKNKIIRTRDINKYEKKILYNSILKITNELEEKNIINDKRFTSTKIEYYIQQGKSEIYIIQNLLKKGIAKEMINEFLNSYEISNPNWKMNSAIKFVYRKKLGKYNKAKNKEKDLAKMARAGFNYHIAIKALNYDDL